MPPAPIPPNEADRLAAPHEYNVLDTKCEETPRDKGFLRPGEGVAARAVAERVREAIATSLRALGWHVTASVGSVTFLDPPADEAAAMAAADERMYPAKGAGRNMVASETYFTRGELQSAD
jgi:GGDEF domain-containing protein